MIAVGLTAVLLAVHLSPVAPTSDGGWVVAVAADATALETRAANELAYYVGELVKAPGAVAAPLPVVTPAAAAAKGARQFGVGPAAASALGVDPSQLRFATLGLEGFLASSNCSALLRQTGSFAVSGSATNQSSGTSAYNKCPL